MDYVGAYLDLTGMERDLAQRVCQGTLAPSTELVTFYQQLKALLGQFAAQAETR